MFQQFDGLRNTISPERLAPNELALAINVDLDDAKQVRRRRGFTLKSAGSYHSLFTGPNHTYVVRAGVLGHITPDYAFHSLGITVGDAPMAYVDVGPDVYFSSATNSGHILPQQSVVPWGASPSANIWISPVVNPTDTLQPIAGRLLGAPPLATTLAYYNGRIYLGHKRTVWATELYNYNYVDKTKNYQFYESDITGIGAVTDGIYVGTKTDVWFVAGAFNEMRRVPIMQYGMIPGSMVSVPAELVTTKQVSSSKNATMFLTESGICVGLDSGQCYNLTQEKVLFPHSIDSAAMFRREDGLNQYVSVMNSAGTPKSTANIGDYVDAEIIRFQGA